MPPDVETSVRGPLLDFGSWRLPHRSHCARKLDLATECMIISVELIGHWW
jgi:hypothetical protein